MKKKRGKAPAQRFSMDNGGITFEYRGFFNYISIDAEINTKIINGLRVDLTDNQILSYFNIKRDVYIDYVQGLYHNAANLRFLVSTVPTKITEVDDVLVYINKVVEEIKSLKESGKHNKEIARKFNTTEDTINRLLSTIDRKVVKVSQHKEATKKADTVEVEKEVEEKEVDIEDIIPEFINLLGYGASNFDFEKIDKDMSAESTKNLNFREFIEEYNYQGIESIVFVRQQLKGIRKYNKPFYPAEDIILETQYSKLGQRVVELMVEVIPSYEVRDYSEYVERLKELKRSKVHPKNSFGLLKEEKHILREVIKKGYPLNNRFLPWYTNQEVQNFASFYGYTDKAPTYPIEYVDIESVDLDPYIEIVKNLKEIKFHDVRWTTDRHNFLKENYKSKGPSVIKEIKWCNKAECGLRVKQFSIKQRYTEEETQKIVEVFKDRGFEGLKEEFPNRTENALRYKIEGLGLIEEPNNISYESLKSEVLEELRAEEIDRIRKEETKRIRKEEIDKVKKELELEVTKKVEERLRKQLDYSIRKELEVVISERELKRTEKEMDNILTELVNTELLKAVNTALSGTLPKDYGTKLVSSVYDNIKDRLEKLFEEKFKR